MKAQTTNEFKYPQARLKGMMEFMEFAREPGWMQEKIDIGLLKKLSVAKGKEGLVVAALRFLGIIDNAGKPTAELDELQKDYQTTMRRLVHEKYADLFKLIPARMVNQKRLVNFFGPPVETAEYQAKLFVWFCEQADIELPIVEKRFHRARFDKLDANNTE